MRVVLLLYTCRVSMSAQVRAGCGKNDSGRRSWFLRSSKSQFLKTREGENVGILEEK